MDELRVTAAYFVKESGLSKAAKLQIMNFLQNEATDAQVMALLLDGEVQTLDEMAEQIVYDRWDAAVSESARLKMAASGWKRAALAKKMKSGKAVAALKRARARRGPIVTPSGM